MKCYWCNNETPDKEDRFEMCKSCYTKTLDGFALIESTKQKRDLCIKNDYITGRFVIVDRDVIKDIVIHNKSDVTCKVKGVNGKVHTSTIRTTFIQRQAMKQVFTLEVIRAKRAIIDESLFQKFMNENKIKRIRR